MHTIRELRWNSKKSNFLIFTHYIFLKKKKDMIFSKQNLYKLKKMLLSLSEISTNEGLLIYDGDNLEVGDEVFMEGDEGLVPAKDGLYTYDNEIIEVEGGVVKTISEKEVIQPEEPMENEEKPEEKMEEKPMENPEEPTIEELKTLIEEQKTMIETLKAENENLKSEIEDLKKKLEEPLAESAEEQFKNEKLIEKETKIDFSKYIKRK